MHCSRGHIQPMFPSIEPGMGEIKEKIAMNMDLDRKPPEEEEEEQPKASDLIVFAGNSTLHGLSHIVMPGRVSVRRVFWACAFLASLSCFLFQVADRIQYYSEYHHVTTLDEEESKEMTFPAITICNYNRFRKSAITKNDVYWVGVLLGVERESYNDYLQALGQNDDFTNFFPSKTYNMRDFVQRTGHNMDEMLMGCRYRNRDCGAENFTTVARLEELIKQKPTSAVHKETPQTHSKKSRDRLQQDLERSRGRILELQVNMPFFPPKNSYASV